MFRVNFIQNIITLINVCTVCAGPLGPPQNLKIENLTSSSCMLVWDPPSFDGGSEIKRYRIERSSEYHSRTVEMNSATYSRSQVTVTKSGRSSQVFSVSSSEIRYTFDDLVEGTKYECKVVAENKAGIATSSEPITFVASDTGTPRVKEIASDSLTIQWEAPESSGGDEITHYVVEVRHVLVLLYGVTIKVHHTFYILFSFNGINDKILLSLEASLFAVQHV